MAGFGGIGNMWNVVREINVSEIKEQAEQPIRIALIGSMEPRQAVAQALYDQEHRYGGDDMAIDEYELPLAREEAPTLGRCDLAILVVDGAHATDADIAAVADQIDIAGIGAVALVIDDGHSRVRLSSLRQVPSIGVVRVTDVAAETLAKRLAPEVIERLPDDQRIAAARSIPALRDVLAKRLINETSVSNATYALTSGIPQMVPVLNIPLNAADILVLTKNQVLLVYKLALVFGASSEFQSQMREVLPVIGGGFFWRQVARQLVGLIPGFGIAPKVAVSYAGTYVVGQAGLLWYRSGEVLSQSKFKDLYSQAVSRGRERAKELIARRDADQDNTLQQDKRPSVVRRLLGRDSDPQEQQAEQREDSPKDVE